jgi:hypothetical protein
VSATVFCPGYQSYALTGSLKATRALYCSTASNRRWIRLSVINSSSRVAGILLRSSSCRAAGPRQALAGGFGISG